MTQINKINANDVMQGDPGMREFAVAAVEMFVVMDSFILAYYGSRCPGEQDPDCACCSAWGHRDNLKAMVCA